MSEVASEPEALALAVVASIVPDVPRFHGPAFNRATQMFQDELIQGLAKAGLAPTHVYSVEPLPSFPRTRRLFGASGIETTRSGLRVRLLPFLNVHPFKVLSVGMAVLCALVAWAWRHRRSRRVIHVINLTMPPGLFVWLAARLTASRISGSILDVWKPGELVPDTWAWRLDYRIQRWLLPRFDGLTVVARAIADELVPGRHVCLIDGGVAPDRFAHIRGRSAEPNISSTVFRVVLSGSLEAYNGFDLAIGAMAHLPQDYELVIAGAGRLADRARQCAAVDSRVVYRGLLGFEELLELYASADLLLNTRLTSSLDTRYFFPSKLMELLASGTPVLSTCTGHVESIYGEFLYLLKDETAESLAARIQEIRAIDPVERRCLGLRAQEFMFKERTWRRQGERLADYLRSEVLATA
jgi:glycosyltransferase involved in cell wall biosynthesis